MKEGYSDGFCGVENFPSFVSGFAGYEIEKAKAKTV